MKCEICNEEVDSRFRCPHCHRYFCQSHWLRENHRCPNLSKELPRTIKQETAATEPSQRSEQGKEGIVHFSEKELTQEPPKPKRKLATLVTASMALTILILAVALSYNVGHQNGYNAGHESGYRQGVADGAGRGYNIRDPTYQEAMQFVKSDRTDENPYIEKNYTCHDYTAEFKNNAFKAGFRCAYVFIDFPEGAHAIVAFNTTNRGLIFIEPQDDELVTLTVGQPYWNRTKYSAPTYDDTITGFDIVW